MEVDSAINECHKAQSLNLSPPLSAKLLVLLLQPRRTLVQLCCLARESFEFAGFLMSAILSAVVRAHSSKDRSVSN